MCLLLSSTRLVYNQNNDGGAQWFADSKKLPEIDPLPFVVVFSIDLSNFDK